MISLRHHSLPRRCIIGSVSLLLMVWGLLILHRSLAEPQPAAVVKEARARSHSTLKAASSIVTQIKHAATPATTSITLAAVGDILLDRGVAATIARYGMNYPFKDTTKLLSVADIAFGNLECPIAEHGTKVHKRFCFKAKPETVQCLTGAGLDMLSLANNHSMDCGRTGLEETMANLRARGIKWCGAGTSRDEAEAAMILNIKGIRVAFVGFCEFLPEGSFLRDDRTTIAFASEEAVRNAVAAARPHADVVIASFHWGEEYTSRPRPQQIKLAHVAVKSGADLVLGHHPHVLQGIEVVKRNVGSTLRPALIAYSLGNFVFDAPRSWDRRTAQTIMLRCTLSKNGISKAEVTPIIINQCSPRPATGAAANAILSQLARLSHELHTNVSEGRIDLEK